MQTFPNFWVTLHVGVATAGSVFEYFEKQNKIFNGSSSSAVWKQPAGLCSRTRMWSWINLQKTTNQVMLMCRLTLTNTKKCTCSHANKFAKTQNENLSHLFLFFFSCSRSKRYNNGRHLWEFRSFRSARYYKAAVFRELVKHRLESP